MIVEACSVLVYEAVTTIAGFQLIKIFNSDARRRRALTLNQSKHLPFVDTYLKRELGNVSKLERWSSLKAVNVVNRISRYESFRLILILLTRKARDHSKNKLRLT